MASDVKALRVISASVESVDNEDPNCDKEDKLQLLQSLSRRDTDDDPNATISIDVSLQNKQEKTDDDLEAKDKEFLFKAFSQKAVISDKPTTPLVTGQHNSNASFSSSSSGDSDDDDGLFAKDKFEDKSIKFTKTECICYFLFIIIFQLMCILTVGNGDKTFTQTYSIRKSIEETDTYFGWSTHYHGSIESEKLFQDGSHIDDIYANLRQIIIPFLVADSNTNDYDDGLYHVQSQQILLGGVRIRQIRIKEVECRLAFNDHPCYDAGETDKDVVYFYSGSAVTNYSYFDSAQLLDYSYVGQYGRYPGGGYIQDLPLDLNDSMDIIDNLESMSWIDGATKMVSFDFTTYNPSTSLHTIVRLVWEMPTNIVYPSADFKTYKFDRYYGSVAGPMLGMLHVIFLLFVVSWTIIEIKDIYQIYKKLRTILDDKKRKKKRRHFWNVWRVFDISNLIIFYLSIFLFIYNETKVKKEINIYNPYPPYQSFRRLQGLTSMENYCLAFNGMLLWIKLFKYLTFSKKLRFLFKMFGSAMQDLVTFMVILIVFYFAFGIVAFVVFSSDVESFRTYPWTLISINRYMFTTMIYDELITSSRMFGSLFYLIWLVWMSFILINVFIAILIDSYSQTMDEIALKEGNKEKKKFRVNLFGKISEGTNYLKNILGKKNLSDIDKDGDGVLDKYEIAEELVCSVEKAIEIIARYDDNGDGVLDKKEFEHLKAEIEKQLYIDEKERKQKEKEEKKEKEDEDNNHKAYKQMNEIKELLKLAMEITNPAGKRAIRQIEIKKRRASSVIANNEENGIRERRKSKDQHRRKSSKVTSNKTSKYKPTLREIKSDPVK